MHMKKKILSIFKIIIKCKFYEIKSVFSGEKIVTQNRVEKRIFLLGTTGHRNLGDQAISYAELLFLKKGFSEYNVIELMDQEIFPNLHALKKVIKKNDLICLHGGGNIGIEYYFHELIRRRIIKLFPENRILIFPQTVDFGTTLLGKIELARTKKIYNNHKKLGIVLREKVSFEKAKTYFSKTTTMLTPDIVLSLKPIGRQNKQSNYILLCLRNDVEKNLNAELEQKLREYLKGQGKCIEADMIAQGKITRENRERILRERWNMFANATMVITDRLHGMVFSYLNSARCIVFPNYNYKIVGTYEWIKDSNFITYMGEPEMKTFQQIFQNQLKIEKQDMVAIENLYEKYIPIIKFLKGEPQNV